MEFIKEIFFRNKLLAIAGACFLALAIVLSLFLPFNSVEVLGINSMIKPIKFSLSIWIYSWSMAYLLYYVQNQKAVKRYSILAVVVMFYEQVVIVIQAFRGKLSHFNQNEIIGGILYAIMGIFIVALTTATLIITLRFIFQKKYEINSTFALSIKIGLFFFVIFSFMGGYMSIINSHNIGGKIGGAGLPILNWSTIIGDLRVAHFLGIHSLQIIPFLGYFLTRKTENTTKSKAYVWLFSLLYFLFVSFTLWQALKGMPFIKL